MGTDVEKVGMAFATTMTLGTVQALEKTGVRAAYEGSKEASKQRRQKTQQLNLQRKISTIKARREARIKAAQFAAATTATGIGGSIVSGFDIGVESATTGAQMLADSQYAQQAEQYRIEERATKQKLYSDIATNTFGIAFDYGANEFLGSFGGTDSTTVTSANRPGGTGTPMYFLPTMD